MDRKKLAFGGLELDVISSTILPPEHIYVVQAQHADSVALALEALERIQEEGQGLVMRRTASGFALLRFLHPLVLANHGRAKG